MILLGYFITAATSISLILLFLGVFFARKDLGRSLAKSGVRLRTLFLLALIIIFFVSFSLLYVKQVEQLYFDENIYQGIALNVLKGGNALWCQYGTGDLGRCFVNQVYHDSTGYSVLIAIAFGIFGIGTETAAGLEFLMGMLSIVFVFMLAISLFEDEKIALYSAALMALAPEIMIWSRALAVPDLAFMTFTILTMFFFVVGIRRKRKEMMLPFIAALSLSVYMRIEGILLIPIFASIYLVTGREGIIKSFASRVKNISKAADKDIYFLALLLFLVLLLLPQVYYLCIEAAAPNYGQGASGLFSYANLSKNLIQNIDFIIGTFNYYPAISEWETGILFIIGMLSVVLVKKLRHALGYLALPILAYLLFYSAFYAGSVGFGVDVRFMLEIIPFLIIAAGVGIRIIEKLAIYAYSKVGKSKKIRYVITIIILIGFIGYPFSTVYPSLTLRPSQMAQEAFPFSATSFIYQNYAKVPQNCLVFSFTPEMWQELNRSSAEIGYLEGANNTIRKSIENYGCFVFDYGYWCTIQPYHSTLCSQIINSYNLSVIATERSDNGVNFSLYKIVNYK